MMYIVFMEKIDARKLDHKTREAIRIRAVQQVEAGESPEEVVKALGYHRSAIYQWIAKYREGGLDALKTKHISGRPTKLQGNDLEKLFRMIADKDPMQYKFPFALWTRDMVRELIKKEFGVSMSTVSVGRLLRKLGFSPQKPLRKAYQRDEKWVKEWTANEFPEIKKLARKENAKIFFADESTVRSDYHSGTTWAPIGVTPTVEKTGARFGINMISAISPKGELRFMTVNGKLNSDKFITFLKRLIYKSESPIFLIVDGHPVHKSATVRKFVEETEGRLRLFFLPPYSPHLNPDEMVWGYLKHHKIGRMAISGPDDLRKNVFSVLRSLQKHTAKVAGFFRAKDTQYILT